MSNENIFSNKITVKKITMILALGCILFVPFFFELIFKQEDVHLGRTYYFIYLSVLSLFLTGLFIYGILNGGKTLDYIFIIALLLLFISNFLFVIANMLSLELDGYFQIWISTSLYYIFIVSFLFYGNSIPNYPTGKIDFGLSNIIIYSILIIDGYLLGIFPLQILAIVFVLAMISYKGYITQNHFEHKMIINYVMNEFDKNETNYVLY